MIGPVEAQAAPWLGAVLIASAQFAAVCGFALLLERTLLRHAAPRTRLALWMAVLLPLALPARPVIGGIAYPWEGTRSVEPVTSVQPRTQATKRIADIPLQAAAIQVERPTPLPAWRTEIDAALAKRIEVVRFEDADPVEAFRNVGSLAGVRVHVDEGILNLLCLQVEDIRWSIANGAVYVGEQWSVPDEVDLRFYRVAPVIEACGISDLSSLQDFVIEYGLSAAKDGFLLDGWDREGWSIETWRGLLAVRATENGH